VNLDSIDWWNDAKLPQGYEQHLAVFLPWVKPWSDGWQVFGNEEGTRVDVIGNGSRIEEVRVRIDVREPDLDLLQRLVDFVADADCVSLNAARQIIQPRVEDLCVEIETSPAASFVVDPEGFLQRRKHWRQ
jgi:hypothetical protein